MAPRPAWKGYLKISLISIPVQAYVGSTDGSAPIRFNQLHKECHSRIRYVKTCPIHGEVSNDEIVSGYEYAKGQYVEFDPEELARLRPEGERAITVDSFVPSESIDPALLSGKMYYLTPSAEVGQKPYQLICSAMEDEKLDAIARMVLTTREHVVRIRPHARLLTVDVLEYATQVKDPTAFKEDLLDTSASAPERKLTRQLITSMVDEKPDLTRYADVYTDRIRELIEARVQGKEIVTATPSEEPHVVNLMDALKQSVRRAHTSKRATKMSRRPAPSVARRTASKTAPRRRKSG